MRTWPSDVLAYGGDYNPEQWPREVWSQDIELMHHAGVTFVTLGVFSWSWLEPAKGEYEFEWLDHIMGLLADGGSAALADYRIPADPSGDHRRNSAMAGQSAELVPEQPHLPRRRPGAGHPAGAALPRPPGAGDVACFQ